MSDPTDRRDAPAELWVVDVTAPLATGRVHEVAADAAARLKLPVEKLVALLENRIGPVTKPLPRASATRVAEVLDIAGADVAVRPADPSEVQGPDAGGASAAGASAGGSSAGGSSENSVSENSVSEDSVSEDSVSENRPAEGRVSEHSASELDSSSGGSVVGETGAGFAPGRRDAASPRAGDASANGATREDAVPDAAPDVAHDAAPVSVTPSEAAWPTEAAFAGEDDDDAEEEFGSGSLPWPAPTIGRAGRGEAPAGPAGGDRDPWASLDEDEGEDEAMLGDWRRSPPEPLQPAQSGAAAPEPSPTARPQGPGSTADDPVHPPPMPPPSVRTPIAQRPPAVEETEDDENEWAYGLRDPFAEAEARERVVRRWVLMIALLAASTIFVALQWAYSRGGPSDRTPPSYAQGLAAYRDGAFVSASRAWLPRAEAGDVDAMYMLGWMAEFGQGRPWSNREAASWYREAAERGHAPSQERLARFYREGLGVDRDLDVALRWTLAAAEAGRPGAQRAAALDLAQRGRVDEARAWLERAADRDAEAAAWWSMARRAGTATSDSR